MNQTAAVLHTCPRCGPCEAAQYQVVRRRVYVDGKPARVLRHSCGEWVVIILQPTT